jgi:hypothetical protein
MPHANTSTLEETRVEQVVRGSDGVDDGRGARCVFGRPYFAGGQNGVQRRAVAALQSLRLMRADEAEADGCRSYTPEGRVKVKREGFSSLET